MTTTKITYPKCHGCGKRISSTRITCRNTKWWHVECAERVADLTLKAVCIAAHMGLLPDRRRYAS
jgi:hypothetical protein